MRKRILSLILVLMIFCTVSLPVSAHEVPDYGRLGSISITMTYHGKAVPGGILTIYRVADVVSDGGDYFFRYTEEFADCSVDIAELNSSALPQELATIAKEKNLKGKTQTVNQKGEIVFSDLEIGLYLIVQEKAAPGYSKVNPFLVSVPYNDDGHYVYDVNTAPKNLPEPEPTDPTEPPPPELPQTGQNNWPVPVLAVVGLLLIAAGICFCNGGKRKRDEA